MADDILKHIYLIYFKQFYGIRNHLFTVYTFIVSYGYQALVVDQFTRCDLTTELACKIGNYYLSTHVSNFPGCFLAKQLEARSTTKGAGAYIPLPREGTRESRSVVALSSFGIKKVPSENLVRIYSWQSI